MSLCTLNRPRHKVTESIWCVRMQEESLFAFMDLALSLIMLGLVYHFKLTNIHNLYELITNIKVSVYVSLVFELFQRKALYKCLLLLCYYCYCDCFEMFINTFGQQRMLYLIQP